MQYIQQPEGSSLCGQTCVAMLAGVSLDEAIKTFGTRGGTSAKQVATALQALGVPCADGLTRLTKGRKKSETCMVILHIVGQKFTHWTVWREGGYFDPAMGTFGGYNPEYVRETSFLPVYI